MAKKTVKKPQVETGTIWLVRGREGARSGYLSVRKMSLHEARERDDEDSVFLGTSCHGILGLPLPKRPGQSLRLTWRLEPEPKKSPTKKSTKKAKRGAKR